MTEKTIKVKVGTWQRLMRLSVDLGDGRRLSMDQVIRFHLDRVHELEAEVERLKGGNSESGQ